MKRRIKNFFLVLRTRYRLLKNPLRFILYEKNNKRYLIVILFGLKKEKVIRRFEIVSELAPVSLEPIEFNGIKIDDCCKRQPSNNVKP